MYLKINNKKISIIKADSFMKRLFGLMFKKEIDYGMYFPKCNAIHTFFMKSNIHVIAVDENDKIIDNHFSGIDTFKRLYSCGWIFQKCPQQSIQQCSR